VIQKVPYVDPAMVDVPLPLKSQPSQETMNATCIGQTPPEHPPAIAPPPISLQQTLPHDNTDAPWGDVAQYQRPHGYFRILSKNISTLNSQNLDMTAIATKLQRTSRGLPRTSLWYDPNANKYIIIKRWPLLPVQTLPKEPINQVAP